MHVPQAVVEGIRSLDLTFHIGFAGEYYFALTSIQWVSLATSNSGTFDLSVLELEPFEVELDNGNIHGATLGLIIDVGGFRLNLLEAYFPGNSQNQSDPHRFTTIIAARITGMSPASWPWARVSGAIA